MHKAFTLALALLGAAACGSSDGPASADPSSQSGGESTGASVDASTFAASTARFGVALYREIGSQEGNLAISPASIATALTMTYGGARGDTALEMQRALQLDTETAHDSAGALLRDWNDPARESYVLRVANRLFVQEGYPVEPSFLALGRDTYGAPAETLDFASAPDPARVHINTWVASQTEDRISELLPSGALTTLTRLVLTNAVYFHGSWAYEFDPAATSDAPFHLDGDQAVDVPTMRMTRAFRYAENDHVALIELPYVGDELAMVILVPREVDGLGDLEANLDADRLESWIGELEATRVEITLPRFRVAPPAIRLKPALRALGMGGAFEASADFSGMLTPGEHGELFIDDVFHRAFVDVNEEGTEAAAATAVVMRTRRAAPPPTPFHADHPFLFLLRDTRSGALLFMGRVADPRS